MNSPSIFSFLLLGLHHILNNRVLREDSLVFHWSSRATKATLPADIPRSLKMSEPNNLSPLPETLFYYQAELMFRKKAASIFPPPFSTSSINATMIPKLEGSLYDFLRNLSMRSTKTCSTANALSLLILRRPIISTIL